MCSRFSTSFLVFYKFLFRNFLGQQGRKGLNVSLKTLVEGIQRRILKLVGSWLEQEKNCERIEMKSVTKLQQMGRTDKELGLGSRVDWNSKIIPSKLDLRSPSVPGFPPFSLNFLGFSQVFLKFYRFFPSFPGFN